MLEAQKLLSLLECDRPATMIAKYENTKAGSVMRKFDQRREVEINIEQLKRTNSCESRN